MKKFFITLFFLQSYALYGQDITRLQNGAQEIKDRFAKFNTLFDSPGYYEQELRFAHDSAQLAYPNCCKAERITPFGISLFVGTGFALGAATTYAILKTLEKTHP